AKIRYYNTKYNEYQRVNINIAQTYIDSIQTLSKKENYVKGIGIATLDKGLLENIKGNFNLAINKNEKALSIFNELKEDTLIAKSLAALGVNYWQKGEIVKSLDFLFKALKINETLDLKSAQAANYNQISMVYQSQNKIPLAEEFANKSMKIIQNLTPELSHISTFHNLANIYGMQGKYKEALRLDSIGLIYCEQLNAEFNKSMFYDNMANCLYYANDWTNAIDYHLKAISIDSSFGNNKQLGDTYCNMGAIYEEQKNYDKALECYNKSIELCRVSGYKIGIKNGLQQLSKLFYKTNNTTAAYHLLQESMIVKDSMINESSEQKIAELQTLFDTEKKKQQIAQQELKISRRNILLVVLLAALIMSVFIFRLVYLRYKLKQEQKLQQELIKEETKRSKAIIETEENERQRLARELHDGVGQLLSATKLNLSSLENNKCTPEEKLRLVNSMDILDESIREIRNISHNMVPDILLKFGLKRAIEDFILRINQTKKLEIHFECNGFEENSLEDTDKLMLYRLIQESVNNTIKYAQATNMTIQLSADMNEISLLMEDNGKGFDIEEAKRKGGIGFKNMQLRTEYLKGKLEIDSSPKNGTTIIIEIPLS
ncbi:MAG TPA: sensor histidine kinase, partial [Chitinophagales bacterium]|nr:sensor histidine kinase [Chitinophagales bacterium]